MSVRAKALKKRRSSPGVVTASFDEGCFIEIVDQGTSVMNRTNHKKSSNGKSTPPPPINWDRQYLRDIEIWLNNCVNFAERIPGKEAAKILKLLREARERAATLRADLR